MKMYRMIGAAVLALSALAVGCDDDNDPLAPDLPTSFTASLTGGAERPPITSNATGTATFTVNTDGTIDYTVRVANLATNVTLCHIHLARPDISGGVLVTLCGSAVTGPITTEQIIATGTIIQGQNTGLNSTPTTLLSLRELMASGSVYVNVHSTAVGSGEIRGNIVPVTP